MVRNASQERLILTHRTSLMQLLPVNYQEKIAAVSGVADVTHSTWFGGIYKDVHNFFPQIVVDHERYFRVYKEYRMPPDQMKAWQSDRTGAVAGRMLAKRFGWKVGDRIPLQGTIWRRKDGAGVWEFTLDGIFDGEKESDDTSALLFRYDYFDETRLFAQGQVGWYIIVVANPSQSGQVAKDTDATFLNSAYETKTSTEKAFIQAFAKQAGDIGKVIAAVLSAVFFTILLVTGNTMMQSVRERTTEMAVLKTLGFSDLRVVSLVLTESMLLSVIGGGAGLVVAWLLIRHGDPSGQMTGVFFFAPSDLARGTSFVLMLGMITGIIPAWQALRLRVVDALRRT